VLRFFLRCLRLFVFLGYIGLLKALASLFLWRYVAFFSLSLHARSATLDVRVLSQVSFGESVSLGFHFFFKVSSWIICTALIRGACFSLRSSPGFSVQADRFLVFFHLFLCGLNRFTFPVSCLRLLPVLLFTFPVCHPLLGRKRLEFWAFPTGDVAFPGFSGSVAIGGRFVGYFLSFFCLFDLFRLFHFFSLNPLKLHFFWRWQFGLNTDASFSLTNGRSFSIPSPESA